MADLAPRLVVCFRTVFPELPVAAIPAAEQSRVPTWDSLATINLAAVIEEEFRVRLDYDRLEYWTSFESVANHLKEILAVSS